MTVVTRVYINGRAQPEGVVRLVMEYDRRISEITAERDALMAERKTHCACIFDGDTNTEQCKLHGAWCGTLHEQADRRKERDAYQRAADDLAAENKVLRDALQKMADHNFTALNSSTRDYYFALKEGMSIALAALTKESTNG